MDWKVGRANSNKGRTVPIGLSAWGTLQVGLGADYAFFF